MPDVMEAVKNAVQSFIDDEPKPPLHVGEVMSCWSYLAAAVEIQVQSESGINSTEDPELRKALHDAVKMFNAQKEKLTSFMLAEGIGLPPLSESKPPSEPNKVPLGVKLTDNQLANSLSIKVSLGLKMCANSVSQSLRTDVGLVWAGFLLELIPFLTTLKSLMQKRGWLRVPPFYYPAGSPNPGR